MSGVTLDGITYYPSIPSEWHKVIKVETGDYKPLLRWDLYSIIGTPLDIDYAKKELSESYSKVEEYLPEPHILEGMGIINFADDSPSFNKYRQKEIVIEKLFCFGAQPPKSPTLERVVSEIKLKCRN